VQISAFYVVLYARLCTLRKDTVTLKHCIPPLNRDYVTSAHVSPLNNIIQYLITQLRRDEHVENFCNFIMHVSPPENLVTECHTAVLK
jgi:hypothetical protein